MLGPSQSLDVEHKASTGTVVLKKTYLPKGWVNYCKVLYRVFFSRCDFCPILACIMGGKLEGMGIIGWLVHHHFPLTRRRHKARKWCSSLPPGPSFSPRRMRRLSYHSLPPRRQNRPSNDRADTAIQHGRGGRRDMGVLYRWRRGASLPPPKAVCYYLSRWEAGGPGREEGEGGNWTSEGWADAPDRGDRSYGPLLLLLLRSETQSRCLECVPRDCLEIEK